jgi:hypothetical protein
VRKFKFSLFEHSFKHSSTKFWIELAKIFTFLMFSFEKLSLIKLDC